MDEIKREQIPDLIPQPSTPLNSVDGSCGQTPSFNEIDRKIMSLHTKSLNEKNIENTRYKNMELAKKYHNNGQFIELLKKSIISVDDNLREKIKEKFTEKFNENKKLKDDDEIFYYYEDRDFQYKKKFQPVIHQIYRCSILNEYQLTYFYMCGLFEFISYDCQMFYGQSNYDIYNKYVGYIKKILLDEDMINYMYRI